MSHQAKFHHLQASYWVNCTYLQIARFVDMVCATIYTSSASQKKNSVAYGQPSAGSAMVYSRTPPAFCATSMTRPPTICWLRVYSHARFGNECWHELGCSTWDRTMNPPWPIGGSRHGQQFQGYSGMASTPLCCSSPGASGRSATGGHSTTTPRHRLKFSL